MGNLRPFQIVMLAIFAAFGVAGLIFLGAYQSVTNQEANLYGKQIEIWGTIDKFAVNNLLSDMKDDIEAFRVVQYRQIDENSFDDVFVNAIAEGRSPDLVILNSGKLVKHRAKLIAISYDSIPLRTFKDTYVDGTQIFTLENGVYAIPLAVDPMVQYWNKDMFASNGLAQAPVSWEEIVSSVVPSITIRDAGRNIIRSAISFGEYRNVVHAKEILMMLALQSGSQMVYEENGRYTVALDDPIQQGARKPMDATLQFYTDFSNANSPLYSWNRAVSDDKNAFLSGDLGLYYGLGSEYKELANKNPNLNFDISVVPQGNNATIKRTSGEFYGFAIPKASNNSSGAFAVAQAIENSGNVDSFVSKLGLGSPRRDIIAAGSADPVQQVLLTSSLIARGWFDPFPVKSDDILMQMVEDVVSNRSRINQAVDDAIDRLILLY